MPLEIDEISIQMRVGDRGEVDDPTEEKTGKPGRADDNCDDPDREQMVNDVVRRVLRALREREAR